MYLRWIWWPDLLVYSQRALPGTHTALSLWITVLISCGTDMEQQYALVVRAWSPGTSVPHLSPSSATYCASVSSSGKRIIIITSEKGGLGELVYGRYIEQPWYLGSVLMIALLLFFTSIFSELKIGDWAIHVLKKTLSRILRSGFLRSRWKDLHISLFSRTI